MLLLTLLDGVSWWEVLRSSCHTMICSAGSVLRIYSGFSWALSNTSPPASLLVQRLRPASECINRWFHGYILYENFTLVFCIRGDSLFNLMLHVWRLTKFPASRCNRFQTKQLRPADGQTSRLAESEPILKGFYLSRRNQKMCF